MNARSKPASGELERDARRLLTRLGLAEAVLRRRGAAFLLRHGPPPEGCKERVEEVAEPVVALCLERGWIEAREGGLVLADAGRANLLRVSAGDDPFRQQHQLWRTEQRDIDGTRRPVLVNEAESPLGWLKSRKDRNGRPLIDDHQYEAGERLRARLLVRASCPKSHLELVGTCAV